MTDQTRPHATLVFVGLLVSSSVVAPVAVARVPALLEDGSASGATDAADGTLPAITDRQPTDPDSDDVYEDVTGDGKVNFNDLVAFYQHKDESVMTDHVAAYDYSGDGELDFNDLVALYQSEIVGSDDTDGDGLDDSRERELGTNVSRADTDGDGLEDGPEVNAHGTDPTAADTDGDGLEDGPEINTYGTNATVADTDGDGLDDGPEVNIHGTDATTNDTDGDGLDDSAEINSYETNATVADTDGDGLDDGPEIETHGTDPTVADTDGDGLDDGPEVNTYGTNATVVDTDGDRLSDGAEVNNETASGVAIPNADPASMDLYVQFDYAPSAERKSAAFRDAVRQEWAEMPVENPDGTTGIDLHIREGGNVSGSPTFDGNNFRNLHSKYYNERLGDRSGVYHQVIFLPFNSTGSTVGTGYVPGYFSVVDSNRGAAVEENTVVHELLHNVMGELEVPEACNDGYSVHICTDGWLEAVSTRGEEQHLLESLANQIERNGFEDGGLAGGRVPTHPTATVNVSAGA